MFVHATHTHALSQLCLMHKPLHVSLFRGIQYKHIPSAKENRTLNERGKRETNLWFDFEWSLTSSFQKTTGNTYSWQLLTQIQGGSRARMWHKETSGERVKVVRTYRRWLTLLHHPLQIMMGFFHCSDTWPSSILPHFLGSARCALFCVSYFQWQSYFLPVWAHYCPLYRTASLTLNVWCRY